MARPASRWASMTTHSRSSCAWSPPVLKTSTSARCSRLPSAPQAAWSCFGRSCNSTPSRPRRSPFWPPWSRTSRTWRRRARSTPRRCAWSRPRPHTRSITRTRSRPTAGMRTLSASSPPTSPRMAPEPLPASPPRKSQRSCRSAATSKPTGGARPQRLRPPLPPPPPPPPPPLLMAPATPWALPRAVARPRRRPPKSWTCSPSTLLRSRSCLCRACCQRRGGWWPCSSQGAEPWLICT
mmetsp:Transcript_5380/g.17895  ORF Transcript_5380/g.17895 Transcript_5380/m.17895 type:complete len:238 (-) Transcript_5380:923-1636(-)